MRPWCALLPFLALLALSACSGGDSTSPQQSLQARVDYGAVGMLVVGDTVRPRLYDAQSQEVIATAWSSSDPSVASVGSTGLVTGIHKGTATIRLSADKRGGSVQVVVGGTLHKGTIAASEAWTVDNGPHVVDSVVSVGGAGAVVLTVGAGVTVFFKKAGGGLEFGDNGPGTLLADGTSAPIVFRALSDTASSGTWRNLTFRGASQSTLINVTLRSCGRTTEGSGGVNGPPPSGCILLLHPPFDADAPSILADNVTISEGRNAAIVLEGRSRFAVGSRKLSVSSMRGHIATLRAGGAGNFPLGGSFTGVDSNEVRLSADTLSASASWAAADFAWHLLGPVVVEGSPTPVLAIAAGSTLRADFGAGFVIGQHAPGSLRVGASTGGAVTMAAAGENAWVGLQFWSHAVASSVTNTTLRRCGAYSNTGYGEGCVFFIGDFGGNGPAPVFSTVTIDSASSTGVVAIGGGRFGPGSSDLTITRTRGIPLEVAIDVVPTIPTGAYAGNDDDRVVLYSAEVTQSMTFRNLGIPYVFLHGLLVEGAANPILTIDAGAELRFGVGNFLAVGYSAPGGLRALGTSQSPVRFVASGPNEHPGWWMRMQFWNLADPTSLLDHVVVENAGGEDRGAAAVEFFRDIGPTIRNSTIRLSAGCGVLRSGGPWTTDFTAPALANQFEQLAGAPQCGP